MPPIRRLLLLAAALVVIALVSGCDGSSKSAPRPLTGALPRQAHHQDELADSSYIAMATQSTEGKAWGLSLFPRDAETVKCVIPGGGPAPGVRVPGTCRTSVHVRRTDEATVRFTETWNIRHYPKIAR